MNRSFLSVATAAVISLLASGCIIVGNNRLAGDITVVWSFNGQTCLFVPQVQSVRVTIPGAQLQNNGIYPCMSNNVAGITLLNFRGGTYNITVEGLDSAGRVVYRGTTSAVVDGNVSVSVNLLPQQGATGGTLNEQQLGSQAAKVVSGVEATQGTITQTGEAYRARSIEVGSTQTVTEALDQNSSIRIQNGMTWNQVIASTNLLVQALNALNLANQSDASQAATTLVGPTDPRPPTPPGRACPTGYSGSGTSNDPCRPSVCSTTPSGTTPDQACVARRYIDSDGNVRVYLELASTLVIDPSPAAANRPVITHSITPAELIDALAASQRRAGATN